MPSDTQPIPSAGPYRRARQAFIAAVEKAGADVIARVHPEKGPDGKPLFADSAAFGPRDATRALMLLGADGSASAALTGLLAAGIAARMPADTRLVLVHAPDPFLFAWGRLATASDWPAGTLAAICGEDCRHAARLGVLEIGGTVPFPAQALPGTHVTVHRADADMAAQSALAFLAAGL